MTLRVPKLPTDYASLRTRAVSEAEERRLGPKGMKMLVATLPEDWLSGLEVETADLRAAGWSAPPAARAVHYTRPETALQPVALPRARPRPSRLRLTIARYAVYGTPLCRLEDAVRFGEKLRRAIMGRARVVLGADRIPLVLSGHGSSGHAHAFYLPEAQDRPGSRPGYIHHAIVYAEAGFDRDVVEVLDRIRRVAEADGRSWQLVLEGIGDHRAFRSPLLESSANWTSVTPYLHPWHRKAGFDVPDQIRRECRERGLPEVVAIESLPEVRVGNRLRRPIHFHRFRSRAGLTQPDTLGSFWRIRFVEPAPGPLALGFACHFGLGLFTSSSAV